MSSSLLIASYVAGAVVDAGAAVLMAFPDRFSAARRYLPPFDPSRRSSSTACATACR